MSLPIRVFPLQEKLPFELSKGPINILAALLDPLPLGVCLKVVVNLPGSKRT